MEVEDYLEQIDDVPSELKSRLAFIRELDSKVEYERDKLRDSVERFFHVAKMMSPEERNRRWHCYQQAAVNIERMAVKKVEECDSVKEMLRNCAERLKLELDRCGRVLEEKDPGVLERIRQNREAERRAQENARIIRDMRKLKSAQRLKAARRRRLNHMRHGRPITSVLLPSTAATEETSNEPNSSVEAVPEVMVEPQIAIEEPTETVNDNVDNGVFQVTKSDQESQAILKLLTEHAESRHGRVRKVSSRVSNGLMYEMRAKELTMRRSGKSSTKKSSRKRSRPSLAAADVSSSALDETDGTNQEVKTEENEDDDNRAWCICHQPSYGFMVACDSSDCPYVWFHGACVGIESPITGKWFCSMCATRLGIDPDQLLH